MLALAFAVGFLIARFANDELVVGRKWFVSLMVVSLICSWFFLGNSVIGFSSAFVFIVAGIAYWKSFDKKWVKRRI